MNNPKSYEFVSFDIVDSYTFKDNMDLIREELKYDIDDRLSYYENEYKKLNPNELIYTYYRFKFRGENGFGALMLNEILVKTDINNNVTIINDINNDVDWSFNGKVNKIERHQIITTKDLILLISNYSQDITFLKAIENTQKRQEINDVNFVTLFGEEFQKLDSGAKLAAIFATPENKDKINFNSTNEEVIKLLPSK